MSYQAKLQAKSCRRFSPGRTTTNTRIRRGIGAPKLRRNPSVPCLRMSSERLQSLPMKQLSRRALERIREVDAATRLRSPRSVGPEYNPVGNNGVIFGPCPILSRVAADKCSYTFHIL
ncbi:hypothetical protein ACJJTC_016423 [Scirpophaga incertulas]